MKQLNLLNFEIPKFVTEYLNSGLTYKSDDTNIIDRDSAGNILLTEGSDSNQLLIIEPVVKNLNTKSLLRVYNTNFQYYTFPVSVTTTSNTSELNVDIDTSFILDPIYARYKPAEDAVVGPTNGVYTGILMDEVVDGLTQINTNCYTISKDAKNSGKDLRFRIKIAHNFNSSATYGTIYWSIMKTGPDNNGLTRDWLSGYASSANIDAHQLILDIASTMRDICDDPAKLGGEYNTVNYEEPWNTYYRLFKTPGMPNPGITSDQTTLTGNQLDAIDYVITRDPKKVPRTNEDTYTRLISELKSKINAYNLAKQNAGGYGSILQYTAQNTYIDEVIPNSEFEIGDIFQIGVRTDNDGHTILGEQTYWAITDASKTVDMWNQEIIE